MRKFLSMMLAVALVLTTLAIPMSAFAAEPVMTVTYAIDSVNGDTPGAEIYPGDEVVVSVSLAAVTDTITITDLEFINTVTNSLDGAWAAEAAITNSSSTEADEDILVSDASISVTTAGTKIMTGTFTMPDTITNYVLNAEKFTAYGGGVEYDTTVEENVTITPLTISVVQPENVIKVGDSVLSSADAVPTVYAQSATITWTSESSKATAAYSKDGTDMGAVDKANGVIVTEAGTYVITITYGTDLKYTRSFTLSTESVNGVISTTIGVLEGAEAPVFKYKRGETFTVPVVLTEGLSEDKIGSVAFTVAYDDTVLSMAKAETDTNVVIENNQVTYTAAVTEGETNDLLSKGETVATLTFTVSNEAAYANTTITFAGVGLAIEGDLSNTNQQLGVTQESTSILVMPADPLAAVDKTTALPATWTKEAYDVPVTTTVGTTKLYVADDITDNNNQDDYKTWYEAATVTVTDSITIESYQDYAIVTKLGDSPAEYQVVIITAEETMFDSTKPEVTPAAGMTDWLRTDEAAQTIAISTFATVADAIPADGAITAEYYIGEAADPITWTESTDGNIDIPKDSEDTKVTIKWTDEAGNETEAKTYDLKLDATAPVINFVAPTEAVEGVKTATFTVTDAVGEVDTDSIKVYTSTAGAITDVSGLEPITTTNTDGTYSFGVSEPTYYYIAASDKAGIPAEVVSGQITFTAATAVTELDVQVVKDGSTLKFYDTTAMAAKNILTKEKTAHTGNGTFTYVSITLPEAAAEVTRTVTLTKDNVADERETYTFDAANSDDIGAYVLTITNKDASGTEATSEFQFSIVAAENIMTVNGNSVYDVADYGRVRDLVGAGKTAPESGALFYGGYYSGDLTGNGIYQADDYNDLIANLRARIKDPANSNYPILNKPAAAE